MLRMSRSAYKEVVRRRRRTPAKAAKPKAPDVPRQAIIEDFADRLRAEFGGAFDREPLGHRFWDHDRRILLTVDDWLCWSPDEEGAEEAAEWRCRHFSTGSLRHKTVMDEAVRVVKKMLEEDPP